MTQQLKLHLLLVSIRRHGYYSCLFCENAEVTVTMSLFVIGFFFSFSVESMWHDSSRKGGESFSLAGNKCTSLSRGKWEDVTIPKAAEVRWAVGLALPLTHSLTWNWESVRGMPGAAGPLWLGSLLGQSRAGVVTGKLKQQGRGNMSCCFKFRRGRSQSEDNFFSESCRAKVTNHGGLQINCTTGRRRNHLVTNQNPFFFEALRIEANKSTFWNSWCHGTINSSIKTSEGSPGSCQGWDLGMSWIQNKKILYARWKMNHRTTRGKTHIFCHFPSSSIITVVIRSACEEIWTRNLLCATWAPIFSFQKPLIKNPYIVVIVLCWWFQIFLLLCCSYVEVFFVGK